MAECSEDRKRIACVLGPDWLTEIKNSSIKVFSTIETLSNHVVRERNDMLCLYIPGQDLKKLVEGDVISLAQVESVNSYYNSASEFQLDSKQYRRISPKLLFLMTTDLQRRLTDFLNAYLPQGQNSSTSESLKPARTRRKKRRRTKNVLVTSATGHFDPRCHKCSTIFQEPHQLECGHRQCQSCIDNQEG